MRTLIIWLLSLLLAVPAFGSPRIHLLDQTLGISTDYMTQGVGPAGNGYILCSTAANAASWQTIAACYGASQTWTLTSLLLEANGSTTSSPAILGWNNWGANKAIRLQFGDNGTAIQVGFGDRMQMYSYNDIEIIAGRATTTPPSFQPGNAGSGNVSITAGSTGKIVLNSPVQANASGTSTTLSVEASSAGGALSVKDSSGVVGKVIRGYAQGTFTSPTTVPAQSCVYNSVTVTDAVVGGSCMVILPSTWQPTKISTYCYVSGTSTAQMVMCNPTTGVITPATITNAYGCSCFW